MESLNFEYEFGRKYPDNVFLLRYMREAIGKKGKLEFSDMTALNLNAFVNYLKSKVCTNSVSGYCSVVKGFLNFISDDVELPTKKFASILRIKEEPQQNIALTEEEVEKIYVYYKELLKRPKFKARKDVLTLFLIECYCGSRGVDVEGMTLRNIHNGMLTYVSQKTHILATVPAHFRLRGLLARKTKKVYEAGSKVKIMRDVCKKCGIDYPVTIFYHGKMQTRPKCDFVGFHTARRSFASILSKRGVPIAEISQYMSHTNITMTQRYIKVDPNIVSDAARGFFHV